MKLTEINQKRKNANFLRVPSYGYSVSSGLPKKPSYKEIFSEIPKVLNPLKGGSDLSTFVMAFMHFLIIPGFILCYLKNYISPPSIAFLIISTIFISIFYNTLWYHRYCSHNSFKFKKLEFAKIFLWTSPLFFREETYVIPHFVHHQKTEKPEDPYGPHLGWIGSFLATELTSKLNRKLQRNQYESLVKKISHIPISKNNFEKFQKTGCIENNFDYFLRTFLGFIFWGLIAFILGGVEFVFSWFSAVGITIFIIRDFNWRGHGGNFRYQKKPGWEFDKNTRALNQHFYGFLAAEWHDNHHLFPSSANNGFLKSQVDLSFSLIKIMKTMGIVDNFIDKKEDFLKVFHKSNYQK